MKSTVKLPIGIENFETIRTEGFYYVDKTGMITELLHDWGLVNLFTRPRRFGKSLNMSMLKYFFSYGCRPELFDGLAIAEEKELCEKYMGKFPVISITLKGVEAENYEGALAMLRSVIVDQFRSFPVLLESQHLSDQEKEDYKYLTKNFYGQEQDLCSLEEYVKKSLFLLSQFLYKHYGQKAIILIDEYDVPLDKAQQYGYYDQMILLIRNMLGQALKTNESLYFAVLTGCLRIARESIFTGLNNFRVLSITNTWFGEYFGFSDKEVKAMLKYYGLEDKHALIQEWYDGYHFGNADVYCPWDVINYVGQLRKEPDAKPEAYWINSSGNAILRSLMQKATDQTMDDLEQLVNGIPVIKKIRQELTYRELYDNIDNLWSVLFTTGYLTKRREINLHTYELVIPNREIRLIFTEQILSWFQEKARKDAPTLDAFCEAFCQGDAARIEQMFADYLRSTISIQDTAVRKDKKENFYHGILLGLLSHRGDWVIASNAVSGNGYSDILIKMRRASLGMVIEIKYAESRNLEPACMEALAQIEDKNYAERLLDDGMNTILKYGIACHKKTCMVRMLSSQ